MERKIRRAAVLGSGVMGAGIAAHLANAGIEVYLLDMVPDPRFRNRLAEEGKKKLWNQKPAPLFSAALGENIHTGNFDDHLELVGRVDWVIEAVIENLTIKRDLLAKVEAFWKPGTIVSSNTSGISISRMAEGRSVDFQRHFLGTHFFNPPRYMKLLEIIPASRTDPFIVADMKYFAEKILGKGVVLAKDTPNFIANRIGVYGFMVTLEEMDKSGLSVADVDALTGTAIGRPNTATFRTLDLVGLDTLVHVAQNVHDQLQDPVEKKVFAVPQILKDLVQKGHTGDKAGRGFYAKNQEGAKKEILQVDPKTAAYIPVMPTAFPCLEQAKQMKGLDDKLRVMAFSPDPGSCFVWNVLKRTLLYSAEKIPEIADEITAIDEAMKWGFNWQLGPFEIWDALGVQRVAVRMRAEGERIPGWVKQLLAQDRASFYSRRQGKTFYFHLNGEQREKEEAEERICLRRLKEQGHIIRQNPGAALLDMGDGVACLEFNSPHNAIGPDILQLIRWSLEEVEKNYRGLVIGNEGKHFCLGANLMLLLMEAQNENWDEIEQLVLDFQNISMEMKYFSKPVVSAPFGMTLGGGVEMCLPAAQVVASAETYMGLVETGVGLIPGGAGTKEMLVRTMLTVDVDGKIDLQPFVNRIFETIAMAKVSGSALEAKELGYLRAGDRIVMNRDHQMYHAKKAVIGLSEAGYEPPPRKRIRVVGEAGLAVMRLGVYQLQCGGYISDHDALIARKLAHVLAGGTVPANSLVSEQYLLDLEREAFLSLCGEPNSQARMEHMLLTGKPLRN